MEAEMLLTLIRDLSAEIRTLSADIASLAATVGAGSAMTNNQETSLKELRADLAALRAEINQRDLQSKAKTTVQAALVGAASALIVSLPANPMLAEHLAKFVKMIVGD